MRLRESVLSESLDLAHDSLCEFAFVTASQHTSHQTFLENFQVAIATPSGHCASQLISLAGRESRGNDRQLHDLLLKNRHTQSALQNLLDFLARIGDGLFFVAA